MTRKELYYAALKGDATPRVPFFIEGFPYRFKPDETSFKFGWMAEPVYRELYDAIAPVIVHRAQMSLNEAVNRRLCIPGQYIEEGEMSAGGYGDRRVQTGRLITPRGDLPYTREDRRGVTTTWDTRTPVNSLDELMQVFEIPFSFDDGLYDIWFDRYTKIYGEMGDQGVVMFELISPVVSISNMMPFELFLELSLTEKPLFREILDEVTRRVCVIIDGFLSRHPIKSVGYLGGSEQCTPPMMNPGSFDEYVVPYDSRIASVLKKHGQLVHVHCHGKVRYALPRMVDIGVTSTDPVEHPPSGDVTLEEAVRIADNKLTIVGNFNFDELELAPKEQIIARTKEILSFKGERIILSSSGGPISRVSPKLAENLRALLETYLRYA